MDTENKNWLPAGWTECLIGDITLPIQKIDPKDDPDQEIIYIDISSIDNVRNKIGEIKQFRLGDAPSRARQIIQSGDVLFSTVRPYLRNIASVPDKYDGQIASTGFSILRPAQGIDPAFLFYKATFSEFVNALSGEQYGVSYPAVKDEQVRRQLVCLPSAAEQNRIAAKIEELFSELEKGVESLKTAREQLKVYRQAVLKHAFEGKLTAQWREDNKDNLETADQLLDRIKRERKSRYQQQTEEWTAAVKTWEAEGKEGKKPPKPKVLKPFTDFSNEGAADLKELPFGWAWAKVVSLFDVVSGGTPKGLGQARGNDIPFYKVSDMNTPGNETRMGVAAIYLSNAEKDKLGLTEYPKDTVIFPKRGGAILTNKKRLLSRSSCFDLNTMGVVNRAASISNNYLWQWFQALNLAEIYDGSNVPQINNKNVEPLPFPICSVEEQEEISEILERQLSIIEENEREIDRNLKKSEALRQSILKKAFSGQLVEQDPSDEPASVLLERIKAEKAAHGNNNKNKKRKDAA